MQRHYDSFELFTGKQRSLTSADSRGRSMSGVVYESWCPSRSTVALLFGSDQACARIRSSRVASLA